MDMWHGHSARTCSIDMQVYIAKTCSIDKDMQHEHPVGKCSKDVQHGNTACACCMYMLHIHAAWRSSRMQLVHAALTCLRRPCSFTPIHSLTVLMGQLFAYHIGEQQFTSQGCTHTYNVNRFFC
jgi:hypothetical protein